MNSLLNIDFIERMRNLMSEAFKVKKYKAMNKGLAALSIIAMLPIIACSLACAGFYFGTAFFYKILTDPIKALHGLIDSEGKDVRHAPQTVIYIISWPTVFFLYALEALMIPMLSIAYAITSVFTYIWTLGGYKFHIFPEKADNMEITVNGKYDSILPLVYVIISASILAAIPLVHLLVDYMSFISIYGSAKSGYYYFPYYPIYVAISVAFSSLYSIFGLSRQPKLKKDETVKQEEQK